MHIKKKETYTLISSDENSFADFYKSFLSKEKEFVNDHLIVDISNNMNTNKEDLLLFLVIAKQKKENNTSFVIVNKNMNMDDFPEYFNIAPTLQEAKDILEMEAMERELGF
ncbi:restriction endonuclease subunit S [Polaribacter litorisediminis]|uniref:restriction endonuclease subunit S n=1 Tax=Polaribacter litorisediminis TaxID=1908341 RepID=UPI001CBC30E8|nr:restriction endonuclease subunit S [Polaribacter litorisediminis]UAM98621.1 restriction endonuclease subunit S [Polaribacter litorisediminis]